ncbi:DUF3360 family protein [Wenyingzhuangia sp. IMCC45467]
MDHKTYKEKRKKSSEFKNRKEYLEHELSILNFRKWRVNLPFRDYSIEIEDVAPGLAATIGKVVMVTAVVAAFAAQFGLSPEFIAENVRYELLIAGGIFVIIFSAILNPNANLSGTHGPMIPLIPIIAAAGGHPLALGILIGVFGIILSITKGGSKLMDLTGIGVRGGLLIYLGAIGLISQIDKLEAWADKGGQSTISFVIIGMIILIYAYLARIGKRWMAIPLCSTLAGLVAYFMGAHFEFTTAPGLPHMNPMWWWGENTGWQMGWPSVENYIAVIPFAILAVAMWSPDFLGHRVFQEINYPKGAEKTLMDVDDTMSIASVRQIIGSFLGGGNITSSWGTYMIPAAIAKRPIPGGALLTAIFCVLAAVFGYPMDLAMWQPVLRVALIVGVFLPLLEAGMQMVKKQKDATSAGTCIFACAFVNPVFGWALSMLLDNLGLIGDVERAKGMSWKEKLVIPGVMFVVCVVSLALAGQLPGIPRIL